MARFQGELRLVDSVVRHIIQELGELLEYDEMVSFGQEGLIEAARRFDPDHGVPFRKYAYFRVRGAVLDGIRSHGRLPRRAHEKLKALQTANLISSGFYEDNAVGMRHLNAESADAKLSDQLAVLATAMAVGISGNVVIGPEGERDILSPDRPDENVERRELMVLVRQHLSELSEQEAMLVRGHFFHDRDVDEIAAEMGLSKSWGSRVMARGIAKLSRSLCANS